MYFKKKAKFFIYHYYFKQKNNKKFDAAIFFPFQWYFECWPIYLPSLPMHLLRINLGLTKKNTQILLTIHTCIWKRYIVLTSSKPKYRI